MVTGQRSSFVGAITVTQPDSDGSVVQRLAVIGVDVDLPEGVAGIDGRRIVELLGELHSASTMGRLQDRLEDPRFAEICPTDDRDADGSFPEGDRPLDVTDVDAVLAEDGSRHVS